jgi:hypothetical protein
MSQVTPTAQKAAKTTTAGPQSSLPFAGPSSHGPYLPLGPQRTPKLGLGSGNQQLPTPDPSPDFQFASSSKRQRYPEDQAGPSMKARRLDFEEYY